MGRMDNHNYDDTRLLNGDMISNVVPTHDDDDGDDGDVDDGHSGDDGVGHGEGATDDLDDDTSTTILLNHPHNTQSDDVERRMLRFRFHGYAIWLDLEQFPSTIPRTITATTTASLLHAGSIGTTSSSSSSSVADVEAGDGDNKQQQQEQILPLPSTTNPKKDDLDQVLQVTSRDWGVVSIPAPHVTALYGISHLDEADVRQRFHSLVNTLPLWPLLEPVGLRSDIEIEGINGGQMVGTLYVILRVDLFHSRSPTCVEFQENISFGYDDTFSLTIVFLSFF